MSQIFIQLIADYGVGDPSFGEVVQKLVLLDPTVRVHTTSVPKFSTLATGFNMVIYTNTAPRKDIKTSRAGNEGEKLVFAKLTNGVAVVGVNAGFCFSFIKKDIAELHLVNVANKGSQFRSRDFYPEAVIGIAHGDAKFIGEKLSIDQVPDVPKNRIASTDGYGNMKTTIRFSEINFTSGQAVLITLGDMKRTAYFTDGTFHVHEGELAFAPGSSGGDDRFMELFLRGLSAWKEFGKPEVEEEILFKPL